MPPVSAARYVTVWCDGVQERGHDCGNEASGNSAKEARGYAKASGWLVGLPNGRDLCLDHLDQRDETTRWGEGGALRFRTQEARP